MANEAISAIFEGGVFRPLSPVNLPEHSVVQLLPIDHQPQVADASSTAGALADCWTAEDDRILGEIESERHRFSLRERSP